MLRKLVKSIIRILSSDIVRAIFVSLALMIAELLVVGCVTLIS